MTTFRCDRCGARWTVTEWVADKEVCPAHCGGVGEAEGARGRNGGLPSEQLYMRFMCRKYEEALKSFIRSLNDDQAVAVKVASIHCGEVRLFERNLEAEGLPLEIPLDADNAFLEIFDSPVVLGSPNSGGEDGDVQ